MKLRLPYLLQAAVVAACAPLPVALISSSTATLSAGVLLYTLANSQAQAESLSLSSGDSYTLDEGETAYFEGLSIKGSNTITNKGTLTFEGTYSLPKGSETTESNIDNYGSLTIITTSTATQSIDMYGYNYINNYDEGTIDIDTNGYTFRLRAYAELNNYSSNDITVTGTVQLYYNGYINNYGTGNIVIDSITSSYATDGAILNEGKGSINVTTAATTNNVTWTNSGGGSINVTTLSLASTSSLYNTGEGSVYIGSLTCTSSGNMNYVTNSGGGTMTIDSLTPDASTTISNTNNSILNLGSAEGTVTLLTGASIVNDASSTLNLNGTIVVQTTEIIENYGTLNLGDELVFDLSSFTESGTYYIFSESSTSADLSSLSSSNIASDSFPYFSYQFNDDGSVTLSAVTRATLSYTGVGDTLALSDGAAVGEQTFCDYDLIQYSGTGTMEITQGTHLAEIELTEGAALTLVNSDSTSDKKIYTVTMGSNATLSFSDAESFSLLGDASFFTSDTSNSIYFGGTDQRYDIGTSLLTFLGTISASAGTTIVVGDLANTVQYANVEGVTFIKTGSDEWLFNHYDTTYLQDYTGSSLIIEEGSVRIRYLGRSGEFYTFDQITIKEGAFLYWGDNNYADARAADVLTFDGGYITSNSTYTSTISTFDYFEVTENGGAFTTTGNINNFIINTLTLAEGATSAIYTFDRDDYEQYTITTVGEVLNFNGTIQATGAFDSPDNSAVSKLYITAVNNSGDAHTSFEGLVYVASTGMTVTGSASFDALSLDASSLLTINENSTVNLTGTLDVNAGSSIENNGTLRFDTVLSLIDVSDLSFTMEDDVNSTYQLITGEGGHNLGELSADNIVNGSDRYLYSLSEDGDIVASLNALVYTGSALHLASGATGFTDSSQSFSSGDNLLFSNAESTATNPIVVTVGNESEAGNIAVKYLTVGADTHVSLTEDASYNYSLDIADLTLYSNSTVSFNSGYNSLDALSSIDNTAIVSFNGLDVTYDLRQTDLSGYSGSFSLGSGSSLYIEGTWNTYSLTLNTGSSYEDATTLMIAADTTISKSLYIAATGADATSNYIEFDIASGVTLKNSAIITSIDSTVGVTYIKSGEGDLYINYKFDNASISHLVIEDGSVTFDNSSNKWASITICEDATFTNVKKSIGWAQFASIIYMQGGTFADASGTSSSVSNNNYKLELQGGDNYFDMSASDYTSWLLGTLQGQTGTETSDGSMTILGNSTIANQSLVFQNINNFDGTYINGGGMMVFVQNLTNDVGESTLFSGEFYATAFVGNAAGEAVFQDTLIVDDGGTAINNNNLTINNLTMLASSASADTLTNNGDLTLYGTVTLMGEGQLINYGDLSFGLEEGLDTVVFDLSNITLEAGTFQIFSTDSLNVDLTSLDIATNLILASDDPFTRVSFNATGGLDVIVLDGENLSYTDTASSIALSSADIFYNEDAAVASYSQYDGISFEALEQSASTTLMLDVADADITYISVGSLRDVTLDASTETSIYQLALEANATLTINSDLIHIENIVNEDASALINIGTADSSLDYDMGSLLMEYTGTVNIATDSSLSISADFAEGVRYTSADSTATLILDGESFNAGTTVLSGYTGDIELESGHLTASNVGTISSLTMSAGTEFTWTQSSAISSDSTTFTLIMEGGDTAETATTVNFLSSFSFYYSSNIPSRLEITEGYVTLDVEDGEIVKLSGLAFGTTGDTTITKTGEGDLYLVYQSNTVTEGSDITLDIQEGLVRFNNTMADGSNGFAFETIIIGTGATLEWSTYTNLDNSAVTDTGTIIFDGGTYLNTQTANEVTTTTHINAFEVTENGGSFHLSNYKSYEIGSMTGEGTFTITGNGNVSTDISFLSIEDYAGSIVNSVSSSTSEVFLAKIANKAGIITSFEGVFQSTGLTKTGDGSASFETLNLTGDMTITDEGSISISDSLSVGGLNISYNAPIVQFLSSNSTSGVTITSLDGGEGSISYEDSTLTNLSISNAAMSTEGDLTLSYVALSNTSIEADNLDVIAGLDSISDDGLTYTITALDGLSGLELTGELTMSINMTSEELEIYNAALGSGEQVSIVITNMDSADMAYLSAVSMGDTSLDLTNMQLDGNGNVIITQDVIPEPSTTALSLLALAGLLARRRRQR